MSSLKTVSFIAGLVLDPPHLHLPHFRPLRPCPPQSHLPVHYYFHRSSGSGTGHRIESIGKGRKRDGTYVIHRSPIPAPIHGAQRVLERLVAADHCRRRRGDKERRWSRRCGRRGGGCTSERGIVCWNVGVEVKRGGVRLFAVRLGGVFGA